MSAHSHAIRPSQTPRPWTIWFVEVAVAALVCMSAYLFVSEWRREGDIIEGFLALGPPLAAAFLYAFGYLWCLSDILGGETYDHSRSLPQRWSDFAMLAVFFALIVTLTSYGQAIWQNLSYVQFGRVLPILFLCCWIMPASVMASERYLTGVPVVHAGSGWRNRVRSALRTFGSSMLSLLRSKAALALGGVAVLFSLSQPLGNSFFASTRGYYILMTSKRLASEIFVPGSLQGSAFKAAYMASLLIAVLAIVAALPGRVPKLLQKSPSLLTAVATISFFELSVPMVSPLHNRGSLVISAMAIAVWMWARTSANRDQARVAAMLFCLPVYLSGMAFMVLLTYFSLGQGMLVVGLLLVWWGLMQSQREVRA